MEDKELEILRIKDVMRVLNIGRDKAYALMHNKSFPSTRIGSTYIITAANLNMWLSDNAGRDILI